MKKRPYWCWDAAWVLNTRESSLPKRESYSGRWSRKSQRGPEMSNQKPSNLIEFADQLAQELVTYSDDNGLSARELLMGLVMTERLLQQIFPGPKLEVLQAVMEGHATFDALTKPPAPQDAN